MCMYFINDHKITSQLYVNFIFTCLLLCCMVYGQFQQCFIYMTTVSYIFYIKQACASLIRYKCVGRGFEPNLRPPLFH